jgi:hypothetical protein
MAPGDAKYFAVIRTWVRPASAGHGSHSMCTVHRNGSNRQGNRLKAWFFWSAKVCPVLGGGLEPPRLAAYAPQTYVSAISPPEPVQGREMINTTAGSRKSNSGVERLGGEPLWSVPSLPALLGDCVVRRRRCMSRREPSISFTPPRDHSWEPPAKIALDIETAIQNHARRC